MKYRLWFLGTGSRGLLDAALNDRPFTPKDDRPSRPSSGNEDHSVEDAIEDPLHGRAGTPPTPIASPPCRPIPYTGGPFFHRARPRLDPS